jgi:hypothetical protein
MPLCQGLALASKNCRPTAFLIPTQQLEKEFPASQTPRRGAIPLSGRRRWRNPGTPGSPIRNCRTNPKLYLTEGERLILAKRQI